MLSNIIDTIYISFEHNKVAFGFLGGALTSFLLAIYKPTRYALSMMIGFIILLVSFEYDKHIVVPLHEQTIQSLNLSGPSASANQFVSLILLKLSPIAMFVIGWGLVLIPLFYAGVKMNKLQKIAERQPSPAN